MAAMQEQSAATAVGGAFATLPPSAFSGVINAKIPPCCVGVPVPVFHSGRGACPPPASRPPGARMVRKLPKQISRQAGPPPRARALLGKRRHECRRPRSRRGGGLVASRRDHHGTNTRRPVDRS